MFYNAVLGFARFVCLFIFRIKVKGRENMPEEGGAILAVNHRSNWDPILAALGSPRHLSFMAKEELFKNPVFRNSEHSLLKEGAVMSAHLKPL